MLLPKDHTRRLRPQLPHHSWHSQISATSRFRAIQILCSTTATEAVLVDSWTNSPTPRPSALLSFVHPMFSKHTFDAFARIPVRLPSHLSPSCHEKCGLEMYFSIWMLKFILLVVMLSIDWPDVRRRAPPGARWGWGHPAGRWTGPPPVGLPAHTTQTH